KWYETSMTWTDQRIRIGRFWEEEIGDYDGYGWYFTGFDAPSIPGGRKVSLVIGAADESADVWLNGEKIGSHDIGELGWDQRFSLDITRKLHPGSNRLAIRVLDRSGPGGLWRPIKILV